MVEFSYNEALELLEKNIATAKAQMVRSTICNRQKVSILRQNQLESDLGYLRDQIITTEVNMARVYNHDVKRRQRVRFCMRDQ